jgi:hypothetical protein
MMHPDTEAAEGEDNVVLLEQAEETPEAEAAPAKKAKAKSPAKTAGTKSAAKKPAAKEKAMKKTAKKAAAKPKAEKKAAKPKAEKKAAKPKAEKKAAKPKAEKKPQAKRVPGTKAQTQVTLEQFKYVSKAAKEDGAKCADFVRDAIATAIDKRFGTTFVKDAKAAAKAAA